jgi:hypothetical protein
MLTWSFGWSGVFEPSAPPAISIARFEMTSFTFMFVWVPDPVCHTRRGKCSSRPPPRISSAAATIRSASERSSRPRSAFSMAAVFLRRASARTISIGMRSAVGSPIEK